MAIPELLTLATDGLLDTHIPPEEGSNVLVFPIQIDEAPLIDTIGLGFTFILATIVTEQPIELVTVTL